MTDAQARATSASKLPARVLIAIVVTLIAWASAFVVIRGVSPHFGGGSLALARLAVGFVVLAFTMIGRKWVAPTRREWVLIVVFGIAWFGAYNVALNIAEHSMDAGTTAMVVNVGPILIALGAGIFLGEGIPKWLAIGAGIAFVGVILIGIGTGLSTFSTGHGLADGTGILWALLAAVTYAIGVLCQKRVLRRLPAPQVTFLGCAIGALACLPFLGELIGDLQKAPVSSILGAVYLGLVPTALAFSTWAYALSKMPAGQLGVTTYVVPAITVLLGLLIFREVPVLLAIVGGTICLGGVAVSRTRARVAAERIGS
jgi:drug/metabolite transporter (DMT)-like permease